MNKYLEFSAEVEYARANNKPIVALESTLITHGFPYPHNFELAAELEDIVRSHDAVPATIALMNGKIKIGLSTDDLKSLVDDTEVYKASRRDIPYFLTKQVSAGTTVAATLYCAHLAGIKIFATGGIGGVHRGDQLDISADLIELSRTPLAVICAGAKAILDLPRTLEFMETFSIPVIGYGTSSFPAFYTAQTQHKLYAQVDEVSDLASVLNTHWDLGMDAGVLIVNPIAEEDEIPAASIEPAINAALAKANSLEISGKAITPFLLQEVAAVTQGKSMLANKKLIKNNVTLAAQLANSVVSLNASMQLALRMTQEEDRLLN